MNPDFSPKFVKRYLDLAGLIGDAAARYRDEVRLGAFPGAEHSFASTPEVRPAAAVAQSSAGPVRVAAVAAHDPAVPADNVLRLYSVPGRD